MNKEQADLFFKEHSIRFISDYTDEFKEAVLYAINAAFGFCEPVKEIDAGQYSRCFFIFKVKNTYIFCHRQNLVSTFVEQLLIRQNEDDPNAKAIYKSQFTVDSIIDAILKNEERAELIKQEKLKNKEIKDCAKDALKQLEACEFKNKIKIKANKNNTFNVDLSSLSQQELEALVNKLK